MLEHTFELLARASGSSLRCLNAGTQLTCFTGIRRASGSSLRFLNAGTQLTCFTGINLQVLTQLGAQTALRSGGMSGQMHSGNAVEG